MGWLSVSEATSTSRKRATQPWAIGLTLVLVNLAAWSLAVFLSQPLDEELPGVYQAWSPPTGPGIAFESRSCSHCPRFALMNRAVLAPDHSPPFQLLAATNLPALWVAGGERVRYGVLVVKPAI